MAEWGVPPVIDAHLQVWDLDLVSYPWITPELGPLHTTIRPERAAAELATVGVDRAVLNDLARQGSRSS